MRAHLSVVLDQLRRRAPIHCSPRQQEILTLIACGLSDKEIASDLGISPHTVRSYLDRFMRDNNCRNRAAAAAVFVISECEPTDRAQRTRTPFLNRVNSHGTAEISRRRLTPVFVEDD